MAEVALIVGLTAAGFIGLCVYLVVAHHRAPDKANVPLGRGIWACAADVEVRYGDASIDYAERRRASAAESGDEEEAEFWEAVSKRLTDLHHIAEPLSFPSILNEPPTGGPPPGTISP